MNDRKRKAVKDLVNMVDSIPCTCDYIYKSRGKKSPNCPKCNYVEWMVVNRVKNLIKE